MSSMNYQIYRNKHSSDEDFKLIHELYAKVVAEDKILCELSQQNLRAGVFVNGQMHPRLEKGPLYFQKVARDVITDHYNRERAAGKQLWCAQPALDALMLRASE